MWNANSINKVSDTYIAVQVRPMNLVETPVMKISDARSKKLADTWIIISNLALSVEKGKNLKNSAQRIAVMHNNFFPISKCEKKAGKDDNAIREYIIGKMFNVSVNFQ